jgi:MYXO-CTERM domain-containing protein
MLRVGPRWWRPAGDDGDGDSGDEVGTGDADTGPLGSDGRPDEGGVNIGVGCACRATRDEGRAYLALLLGMFIAGGRRRRRAETTEFHPRAR